MLSLLAPGGQYANKDGTDFVGNVDYSGWLSTSPAGVEDAIGDTGLALGLYPNPFSHRIALSMHVSERQVPVSVDIFDVRGRLVRRLAAIIVPGETWAEWDGRDDFGAPAAPGTYYLAIRSRAGTHTAKLILVR